RDTGVLVHLRAAAPRHGPAADGRQEHLAALQDVWSPDRLPDAEAARPSPRSGDGGLRAAPRSRAGPRPARPYTHRDDPALRADSAGRAKARRGVLRSIHLTEAPRCETATRRVASRVAEQFRSRRIRRVRGETTETYLGRWLRSLLKSGFHRCPGAFRRSSLVRSDARHRPRADSGPAGERRAGYPHPRAGRARRAPRPCTQARRRG